MTVALAAVLMVSCKGNSLFVEYPQVFAHRGCWIENYIPENSLDGVEMAARYGYPTTECDVRLTADSVHVLMHDPRINRTMRNAADYSEIVPKTYVKDLTLAQLREGYVLASDDVARRKPIPTFKEYLEKCAECGIKPILHCDIFSGYVEAQELAGSNWIAFSTEYDVLMKVREMNPDVLILYAIDKMEGDKTPEEVIARLEAIGGRVGISSMNRNDQRAEMCSALRARGYEIQSSIVPTPHDMTATKNGVTILLTDFAWFQTEGRKPVAKFIENASYVAEGACFEKTWDEIEYGAIVVKVCCKGEYELTVNGTRTYTISHDGKDTELVGVRFYKTAPSISLKCLKDGGSVKEVKAEVYSL